jgi:hypothetical protein
VSVKGKNRREQNSVQTFVGAVEAFRVMPVTTSPITMITNKPNLKDASQTKKKKIEKKKKGEKESSTELVRKGREKERKKKEIADREKQAYRSM